MPEPESPRPIVLNVGITGHRAGVLTAPYVRSLRPVVSEIFKQLREAALNLRLSEDTFCSRTEPRLLLHTGLASGADQIAAKHARSSGYRVHAVLPFEPDEYRKDFAEGRELHRFERALAAADDIIALPGQRSDLEAAYVLVGESLVQQADVIVAIWDGQAARGRGGTAEVVRLALRNSVPVIHVDISGGSDKIRTRALTEEGETSIDDPELYQRVLRGAFKLGPVLA